MKILMYDMARQQSWVSEHWQRVIPALREFGYTHLDLHVEQRYYFESPPAQLPQGWSTPARRLIAAPVAIAKTPRPVIVSTPEVEACRLQSAKGIAVTLLNWNGAPLSGLTVTVPNAGKFRKVSLASGGAVKSSFKGDTLTVTLALKDADVLMIE